MRLHSLVGGTTELIGPEATLAEAAARMVGQSVDCVAVVEGRNMVGLLTEHDIVEAVAASADPEVELVATWMTASPDTFGPDDLVVEAIAWLMQTGYRHLPVTSGSELLGIVGVRDLLWAASPGGVTE
jgi:CBS domain-containing protein